MDISKIINDKKLTEIEEKVLKYILDNIDNVIELGVRGIAKNNFTSTSTIMRLSKKMGYTGFIDMQYNLMSLAKRTSLKYDEDNEFIKKSANGIFMQYNSKKQIEEFVDILMEHSHKFLFIYATGFSGIIAEYVYKKLLVLGKKCIISSGTDSVGVFENNLDDIMCMIIISKSGETKLVLDKVKTAKENSIKVVSFTNEDDNSVSKLADISFKIEDINKLDDRNIMPNTFFPNLIMLVEFLIYNYHKRLNKD
ncbi:MurR/RpiR family transcriptional regulator [Clostridium uliginosum]|uniref:DNA-binding transcriptional regulator, MurR/RpiR family, contains HTH and SIS domains n=1 Tax=Clostridium uliginosum TaxID=119641 RepID=A0A1I1RGY3_9CLOT|nr:MurR/RpiR family transcriptional regulator [Clostridium uliginosum]SFD29700.1 DNA-binding transcriptional regulator, MurR/RpiR family, contains HTH and SIS domains [Clostridium uliginosum]